MPSSEGRRHPGSLVLLLLFGALGLFLVGLGLVLGPAVVDYVSRRDFEAALWKRADTDRSEVRRLMVEDLMASRRLDGRTRPEVEDLLGPPAEDRTGAGEARYWLGSERGAFAVDSEWLVIRYGAGGRVREYHVAPD